MNAIRRRFRLDEEREAGLSLIEIIISMMIFAIIMLGVGYSVISTLKAAKDGKGREVALNLAAQAIDSARAVSDVFTIPEGTVTATVPGDSTVYSITTTADWVTSNGSAANCGSGSGTLQYKEVNITVTWPGMIADNPVRADTIVAPKTTINDPALGTMLVSVKNAAGVGVPGVTITSSPSTGTTIPKTDADGCAYVLKVPPGTYTLTASLANYIDVNQVLSPVSTPQVVTAGGITSTGFAYDLKGAVTVKYASAYAGTPKPTLPTGMLTSFNSTIGGVDNLVTTSPTALYPASSYTVVAGGFAPATQASQGCLDVDPSQWPDGVVAGKNVSSPDPNTLSFLPGAAATVEVPMGVLTLSTGGGTQYVKATVATPPTGSGDPGCGASPTTTYSFGPITATSGKVTIALPYGSYTIQSGGALASVVGLVSSKILAGTGVTGVTVNSSGVVTLDPRVVVP